ncbi:CPBP family intramembrane glutamic endopeptidase [Haloplanus litoreus]|uniref:CPBP family intramembrane glutamic endopeptidase n=2 Tax=Haloplanus litoreus TaxID=767515 RepID=A0ABD5ZWW2_9EURY
MTLFHLILPTISDVLAPVFDATGGLVGMTLLANLAFVVVIVGGIVLQFGDLRPRDIGLVWENIPVGIGITAGTWILMQVTGVAALILQDESLALADSLTRFGILPVLGGFVGQILGNALYEETVYRAFLLPQLAKKFARMAKIESPRTAFLFALLASQTVFTLVHVPGRFAAGVEIGNLPTFLVAPFVLGVLFALIYARTGNLFVTIGLHALVNDPVLLVDAGGIVLVPLLLVVLAILVTWPSLMTWVGAEEPRSEPSS